MQTLQKKLKAVTALVGTFLTSLLAFYNLNQNVTLKEVVSSVVAAVVTAVAVHQVPNK